MPDAGGNVNFSGSRAGEVAVSTGRDRMRRSSAIQPAPRAAAGPRTIVDAPVHPFLIGSAFVLNLWSENLLNGARLVDVIPLWAAILAGSAATFALAFVAARNPRFAGALTTVVVVWALSFGHLVDAVQSAVGEDQVVITWVALGIGMLVLIVGVRRWVPGITRYLNVVGLVVVVLNLVPIVPYQIAAVAEGTYRPPGLDSLAGVPTEPTSDRRDIYYIVLDRYPSQQTLAGTAYEYDNGPFLRALEERGFYVAPYSHANYTFTALSVASSLNMAYLDVEAMAERAPASDAWKPVYDMLAGSLAAPEFLERQGYTYVQLPSWFEPTAAGSGVDVRYRYPSIGEFADALYRSTVFPAVIEQLGIATPNTGHVDHALFQFAHLPNLDETDGPKFVFAHIMLPHPPYAFGPDGPLPSEQVTDGLEAPREAFLGQLEYTNTRVLEVVDELLRGPDEADPIVILQADEGPYNRQVVSDWRTASPDDYQVKFGILNAYHMPGVSSTGLYPSITPVNSFRVLFNTYFGADFPVLDDRIYAIGRTIYDNVDITDELVRAPSFDVIDPARVDYEVRPPDQWTSGASESYEVMVTNTGDVTWRSDGPDAVSMSVRFEATDGSETPPVEQAFPLQRDLAPGKTARMEVEPAAPDADGEYLLSHRLAHGVTGFRPGPSTRVSVSSTLETWDELLVADYRVSAPTEWTVGSTATYEVRVTNRGTHTWSASGDRPVRLGVHFGHESDVPHDGWLTDERYRLPHDVAPGRSVVVEVEVAAPQEPGSFVLRHRLVKENVAWFGDVAGEPVVVNRGIDVAWVIAALIGAVVAAGLARLYLSRARRTRSMKRRGQA